MGKENALRSQAARYPSLLTILAQAGRNTISGKINLKLTYSRGLMSFQDPHNDFCEKATSYRPNLR